MISLALLGKDISHSRSPEIYKELCQEEIDYKIFDCQNEKDIPTLVEIFKKYQGLSITSPYKRYFLNQVEVGPKFSKLNAINAVRKRGEKFEAINTDFLAIEELIEDFNFSKALILGDGVMSFITQKVFEEKNIEFKVYSRKKLGPIENLNLSKEVSTGNEKILVINTCSRNFVFKGLLPKNSIFWDYNYEFPIHRENIPTESISYIDGLSLLRLQAKFALKFFRF